MIYKIQFLTHHLNLQETFRGQFYWFESDLSSNEFSDLIFRHNPFTMNLAVSIISYPNYSNCEISCRVFDEVSNNPDTEFTGLLQHLRNNLEEINQPFNLITTESTGTVIIFQELSDRIHFQDFDHNRFTSQHFKISSSYNTYSRVEIGASGLFETVTQNLAILADIAQILSFFIQVTQAYFQKKERLHITPLPQTAIQNPIDNMKRDIAIRLNIDIADVHIFVQEARLNGPYMRVDTNYGKFEVQFDPNNQLIQILPY